MKIAFFGLESAFNHEHIGGINSFVRRLALNLEAAGDDISFVYYGCVQDAHYKMPSGIDVLKFKYFSDALSSFEHKFDHVVSIYLLPKDRLAYAKFRNARNKSIVFHHIYFVWNESSIKRKMTFVDARLFPYNGCLFGVSTRFCQYVATWSKKSVLFLPPVPEEYFVTPEEKTISEKIRVTYCGRIDERKGAVKALDLFQAMGNDINIKTRICGYPWSHRPETMSLHEQILSHPNINYEPIHYEHWTLQVDANLRNVLEETDILLLPYRKLSSTIDTPLLLLEGMASLCVIITPNLGNLKKIYGDSKFDIGAGWHSDMVINLIKNAHSFLREERERIYRQNKILGFNTSSVGKHFRESIAL